MLANEPRSGVCSRASSLLRRAPSPQPSPASGRGGRSAWADDAASAGEFVGRITVRGYAPLAVPPGGPAARLLVGASPSPQPSPASGRGGRSAWTDSSASAGEFVGRITVCGCAVGRTAGVSGGTASRRSEHPHPSPLPGGEGASPCREEGGFSLQPRCLPANCKLPKHTERSPLPSGRGLGRGRS